MTRAKHVRSTNRGRLIAGALSVPMALTMTGTAFAAEPIAAEPAVITAGPTVVENNNNGGAQSEADVTLVVTCTVDGVLVQAGSDKDLSNVKVFLEGGGEPIEVSLSGTSFEGTFTGDVIRVTVKSGTTEIAVSEANFKSCTPAPVVDVPVVEEPVVDVPVVGAPVVGAPVVGAPVSDLPAPQPGSGAVVVAPTSGGSAPVGTLVVALPISGTPVAPAVAAAPAVAIAARPAPTAGSGVVTLPVAPQAAVRPTFGATQVSAAAPTALPFTGGTTALLLALGTGLVIAGGGFAAAGRREQSPVTTA